MNNKEVTLMLVNDELIRAHKMQLVAEIFEDENMKKKWFLDEYRMTVLYRKLKRAYKMNDAGKNEDEIMEVMNELEKKFQKDDFGIGL